MSAQRLVRVAIAAAHFDGFDYLVPAAMPLPPIGTRVRVPFRRSDRIGVVLAHPISTEVAADALKTISETLDADPLLTKPLLEFLQWAAKYYHHGLGEVVVQSLPQWLREGRPLDSIYETAWQLTAAGIAALNQPDALRNAPRQLEALRWLQDAGPAPSTQPVLAGCATGKISPATLRRLAEKDWVQGQKILPAPDDEIANPSPGKATTIEQAPTLTDDQRQAVAAYRASAAGFATFLLQGVTGSGKTEVYLQLIEQTLAVDQQALLLVPEIGLTPQLVGRLKARFGNALAVLHSALTDRQRLLAWYRAHSGAARLVVGTRSAIFASLPDLGLIVVDEEHDLSFKQQTGFRYHARDLAIVRARKVDAKVILGSATPSFESLHNVNTGRYVRLSLPKRIGAGGEPKVRVIDLGKQGQTQGLSSALVERIEAHLAKDRQVILFLNRRGFAPALLCTNCGNCEQCDRCDARMTVHARAGRLRCHHCGREALLRFECPVCGNERVAIGQGTQRINEQLEALLPDRRIARLDRDVTNKVGALNSVLADVASGKTEVIVGTQMLTKGHDFPGVTLVGILDADQGLFGTDFRSEERLAQTIVQVAGRAGRRDEAGEVVLQTYRPDHPTLQRVLKEGYEAFTAHALIEREQAQWPPFTHVAAIRAESGRRPAIFDFLEKVRGTAAAASSGVTILGPAIATMERRNNRFRAQLLLQCSQRAPLHKLLDALVPGLPALARTARVRFSVDVDPVEL